MAVGSRALSSLLTIVVCWGIASSAPAGAKPADKPPEVPVELLASVALGPASTLHGLQKYLEVIRPGIGAAITDQVIRGELAKELHVTSLDGLDPAGWMYILFSDAGGEPTITLLGKISDQKRLLAATGADHLSVNNGWALIGKKAQLDRLYAYAFDVIARQPIPRLPAATVFVPQLLTRYQPQLAQVKAQTLAALAAANGAAGGSAGGSMNRLMTTYIEGLASVSDDTQQVILTFDAAPDVAALDIALVPRDKSRLAEFAAAQRPSDFGLLDKLPALSTVTLLLAGRFESSVYHEGVMNLLASFFDPSGNKQLIDAFDAARKAMSGELAMSFKLTPGVGTQVMEIAGLNDAKLASQSFDRIFDLFKAGRTISMEDGVSSTIKTNPETKTYDGIALRAYDTTFDLSKASEARRAIHKKVMPQEVQHTQVAIYDALTSFAASPDSMGDIKNVIDASRGKPGVARFTPSPAVRAQLAAARARKDSTILFFDLSFLAGTLGGGGGASPPLVVSFGAADRNAHFRITLPAETLHAVAGRP